MSARRGLPIESTDVDVFLEAEEKSLLDELGQDVVGPDFDEEFLDDFDDDFDEDFEEEEEEEDL